MKDCSPIVVLGPADKFEGQPDSHINVKDIKIVVSGEPIHLQVGLRNQQATLLDIISFARFLSSQIVQIAHKRALEARLTIPCRKGCSACCFHLVPLAIPEAVYLAEEVMGMSSEVHAQAERRCWEIANQVELSFPDFLTKNTIRDLRDVHKIGSWFRELNIPCAFLVDHECSIYEARPGACREWSVTGTALACLAGSVLNSSVLHTTGGMTVALASLTAKLQHSQEEIVPLYLMFKCRKEHMDLLTRTWPSTYLIDEYVHTVMTLQERNDTATV